MSDLFVHQLYAALAPWSALTLFFLGRNPHPSRRRMVGSSLLSLLLLLLPLPIAWRGWSPIAWIFLLEPNPSFILTSLLLLALLRRFGCNRLFSPDGWRAAWIFGCVASLILYPMALGLTSLDTYSLGWRPALTLVVALVAIILILRKNPFGVVLLTPFAGYLLRLQESRNFWDAILDPFYGGLSLIIVIVMIASWFRGHEGPDSV